MVVLVISIIIKLIYPIIDFISMNVTPSETKLNLDDQSTMLFDHIEVKPSEINIILYKDRHDSIDGFGAAFSAWKLLGDKAKYIKGKEGGRLKNMKNKNIAICGVNFDYEGLAELINNNNKIVVLHNYSSSYVSLKIDRKCNAGVKNHSRSYIAWCFFNKDTPIPKLISYIEDSYMCTRKYPDIDCFSAISSSITQEFGEFDKLLDDNNLMNKIKEGNCIIKYEKKLIESVMPKVSCKFVRSKLSKFYVVAYLQVSFHDLKGTISGQILRKYKHIDFCVIYSYDDSKQTTSFSLRSDDHREDVCDIAQQIGGGGYRNASGAYCKGLTNELPQFTHYNINNIHEIMSRVHEGKTFVMDGIELNTTCLNCNRYTFNIAEYLLSKFKKNIAIVWYYDIETDTTNVTVCCKTIVANKLDKFLLEQNFYGNETSSIEYQNKGRYSPFIVSIRGKHTF